MKEVEIAVENYTNALQRLVEGIEESQTELGRDGVIQRFEFTFELFWKTLKILLNYEGVECKTPRNCIKTGFKNNLVVDDEIFLDMLKDRNLSSHVYDKVRSREIFKRIKDRYMDQLIRADHNFKKYLEGDT